MAERRDFDPILEMLENENDAFMLIHAIRAKFGLVGTEFCRADVAETWDGQLESGFVEGEFTDDHWDACMGSRTWLRTMQDAMVEAGNEIISEYLIKEIEEEINNVH